MSTIFDKEMMKALEADGEMLRQMTGEDHGPWDLDDDEWLAELEAHEDSLLSEEELEACKARGCDNQRPQGGEE